jgi:hypothetical protein
VTDGAEAGGDECYYTSCDGKLSFIKGFSFSAEHYETTIKYLKVRSKLKTQAYCMCVHTYTLVYLQAQAKLFPSYFNDSKCFKFF